MLEEKYKDLSSYSSELDKRVFNYIKTQKAAYKREIELNLEFDYPPVDVGQAIKWFYKAARFKPLSMEKRKGTETYDFYFPKSIKKPLYQEAIERKFGCAENFAVYASNIGQWVSEKLYPDIFENLGFQVIDTKTKTFARAQFVGDIDIILETFEPSHTKIFVDVKNRLPFYDQGLLLHFINNLRLIRTPHLKIVPIVIARRIYEEPSKVLESLNGIGIEMEKILIPQASKEISCSFNENIADICRVVPERLIQPDFKTKLQVIKRYNEGFDFSSTLVDEKIKPIITKKKFPTLIHSEIDLDDI
nr:hypothetical protein [Candidatus Sigynarchaeota archaeon]